MTRNFTSKTEYWNHVPVRSGPDLQIFDPPIIGPNGFLSITGRVTGKTLCRVWNRPSPGNIAKTRPLSSENGF